MFITNMLVAWVGVLSFLNGHLAVHLLLVFLHKSIPRLVSSRVAVRRIREIVSL